MEIRPVLSALRRHRISALLITLEIALACAVLCNGLFLAMTRLDMIGMDSGVNEASIAVLTTNDCWQCEDADINGRWLDMLRSHPGVLAAGVVNSLPFAQRVAAAGVTLGPDDERFGGVPHFYLMDPDAVDALQLEPARGRRFTPADYRPVENFFPVMADVWITRSFAEHLWPGEDPLGQQFRSAGSSFVVVGILDHFAQPAPGRTEDGVRGAEWSVVVPVVSNAQSGTYVVRADPQDLPRIVRDVVAVAPELVPEAILDREYSGLLSDLRHAYFVKDRTMTRLLLGVCLAMLLVTALGIIGLASFWVQQRTRQIGVRRALGATRRQIVRYFQVENLLLSVAGIVLGMLMAYGGNQLLMRYFEVARLPLLYLPVGAVLLLLLGQIAVIGPALRAAAVSPIVATRGQ